MVSAAFTIITAPRVSVSHNHTSLCHLSLFIHRFRRCSLHRRTLSFTYFSSARFFPLPSAYSNQWSSTSTSNGAAWCEHEDNDEPGSVDKLRIGIGMLRSVLPGGSWWRLDDLMEGGKEKNGRDVTVMFALERMRKLVGDDKWIVFSGFAFLVLAVVHYIFLFSL